LFYREVSTFFYSHNQQYNSACDCNCSDNRREEKSSAIFPQTIPHSGQILDLHGSTSETDTGFCRYAVMCSPRGEAFNLVIGDLASDIPLIT
jgi:hypothetical protein